jgi:hypothetical protein
MRVLVYILYIYVIIGIYIIWVGLQSVLIFSLYSITLYVAVIEAILAGGLGGLFFRILQTQKISGSSPKKKVFFFFYYFSIDFVLRPPKSGRSFRPSVCMSERAQELFKYSVQSLYQVHQLTYVQIVHAHTIRTGT